MQKKQTIPAKQRGNQPATFGRHEQTIIHQSQQTVQTIFDPEILRSYKEMVPDAPERVLTVFELNSATERHIATASLAALQADNKRRDWMAFTIIIGGMLTSAFFAYLKINWLSGAALVAIIFYAVIGYLQKNKTVSPPK